ncbi:hypothetical protein [Variovorax ginsengisoli]|uniref:DUF2336 domain-containing protein n=1 Tax=Variovorax ginsengisoli TaxID=363844 RepID=A0ABT8SFN2_9BURK|nr:hypothetical protein [Variovorax ginsengisoli]MDN8618013.1 hypothetical protein [Variovorax ginsengisoli]MDO1537183.1 hypothetical protein [Variovorax ginsengisoli]
MHAMSPADRAWTLEELPTVQRDALRKLLDELESLGIVSDPTMIAEAIAPEGRHEPSLSRDDPVLAHAPQSAEDMLHALDEPGRRVIVRLMQAESADLVAAWLRVDDWPWRDDILQALDAAQRRQVEAALVAAPSGPVPPAQRAALIDVVVAQLRKHAPVATSAHRRPLLRSALNRIWPPAGKLRGATS